MRDKQSEPEDQCRWGYADPEDVNRVHEVGYLFLHSAVLLSAIELGVFSALEDGPLDTDTLRRKIGIHERGARDFFDVLAARGFLVRPTPDLYYNTPLVARYFVRGKREYRGTSLEGGARRLYRIWSCLTEGLRSGLPQNETKAGGEFYDAIYCDAGSLRDYHRGLLALNRSVARAVARSFPWANYATFADIGTAQGGLPVEPALAYPHLRGCGLDSPLLAPVFEEYVASFGLGDRVTFQPGDFFTDRLPRADVLILGHILHNWTLDQKRLLIRKAYAALPVGGVLIIYEKLLDDDRTNIGSLLSSLNQLLESTGGFEFTAAEARSWLADEGFATTSIQHLVRDTSMLVATK